MMLHPMMFSVFVLEMGVSKNRGTPKSSIFMGFSIIKPSILGGKHPYFWKHPNGHVILVPEGSVLLRRRSGHVAEFFAGSLLHPI